MLIRSTTKEKETYMLKIQNYVRAKSLEEAWQLNQNKRNRVIGGMMWMKMSNNAIGTAIDLCDLGLDKIEETEEKILFSQSKGFRITKLKEYDGTNECEKIFFNTSSEVISPVMVPR